MKKAIVSYILSVLLIVAIYLGLAIMAPTLQSHGDKPELKAPNLVEKIVNPEKVEEFAEEVRKEKISEAVQKHTVSIFSLGQGLGFCSGVVIGQSDQYTYVVTCKHCVSPTEEVLVENTPADAIFTPMDDDLALIIIKGSVPGKIPASLAKSNPRYDEELIHIGYPAFELYESWGKVLRTSKDWQWASFNNRGGCSGGGVYNQNKELVGILWGRLAYDPISIYEPINDVKIFLKRLMITLRLNANKPRRFIR